MNRTEKHSFRNLNVKLKVVTYHGSKRDNLVDEIQGADIVLTTYNILVADHLKKRNSLPSFAWFRVVLDEGMSSRSRNRTCHRLTHKAHIIRRQSTKVHKCVADLDANFRWCLTGTPIQNRLDDIGALFSFIRAKPFDSMGVFRKYISAPFDQGSQNPAESQKRLTLLMDSVCLRRTKELLDLPGHQERIREIEFTQEECSQYEETMQAMNRRLRQVTDSRSRFGMFQVLLQLRILCNLGTFQQKSHWAMTQSLRDMREDARFSISHGEEFCFLCLSNLDSYRQYRPFKGTCAHVLCSECVSERTQQCPICEISLAQRDRQMVSETSFGHLNRENYFRAEGYSSKMAAMMTDLRENLWASKRQVLPAAAWSCQRG